MPRLDVQAMKDKHQKEIDALKLDLAAARVRSDPTLKARSRQCSRQWTYSSKP